MYVSYLLTKPLCIDFLIVHTWQLIYLFLKDRRKLAPEQANQASCLNKNNYLKACRAKWVKHFSFSPKLCTRHVSVELKTTKAVVNKNLPQRLSCFLACVVKTETEKKSGTFPDFRETKSLCPFTDNWALVTKSRSEPNWLGLSTLSCDRIKLVLV